MPLELVIGFYDSLIWFNDIVGRTKCLTGLGCLWADKIRKIRLNKAATGTAKIKSY